MKREPTAEVFLGDVANHRIHVLHHDGLYRHIRFKQKVNSWNMWFDLVTWPGNLTIRGDMGTWTFSRLEDMFEFFRSSNLEINASYWAEKIQNGVNGGRDNAKDYDQTRFCEQLAERLTHHDYEPLKLAELKQALQDEVLYLADDCKYDLMIAARDFKHTFTDGSEFTFDPCELPDGKDYSYQFIWCLHAIVWGIQQFDLHEESRKEAPLHVSPSEAA